MPWPAEQMPDAAASNACSPEPLSDEAVIERVRAGDIGTFELLMRRYNQRLFRISRGILSDDNEAEDVVQETYVRAFQNLHQFQGHARFSTWLTKIAVHEASARQRKRQRLRVLPPIEFESQAMAMHFDHHDATDQASRKELGAILESAVDALPSDLRAVFMLRMVEQLDTQETADCLGLSAANVKTRLHRANLLLRTWIDRQIGEQSRQLYLFDGAGCDRIVANVISRIINPV